MADDPSKQDATNGPVVQRLVRETSITEEQARELIALLGMNWSSLLREARQLNRKR
ncbi:hypothetical protein [Mesorhizobium sp. ZC-5]|jgi:hypothetical protein|uniref:hypothetical protein n=1 Tax=Mesorhizobium sp. ZC-5 TaxID=2986066 RepID=UPI0021E90645|nr:hypothetical protein [Mesorhizobium sp. ZC-5]MCV3243018.1 hypothetical protein [Mesorhizobium sp. ZC-5]